MRRSWSSARASEFLIAPIFVSVSQHDSDKQELRGGACEMSENDNEAFWNCSQPLWINVLKDSTRFPPSTTEQCRGCGREIDTSVSVTRLSFALLWTGGSDEHDAAVFVSVCVNSHSARGWSCRHVRRRWTSLWSQHAHRTPAEEERNKTQTQKISGTYFLGHAEKSRTNPNQKKRAKASSAMGSYQNSKKMWTYVNDQHLDKFYL